MALAALTDAASLFANAPIAAQIFDEHGTSVWMNEANRALLRLPSTTYAVGSYNILTDPWSSANGYARFYGRAYTGELVQLPEVVANFSDPENQWATRRDSCVLSQTVVPLPDGDGVVRAILLLTTEVTDLAAARADLGPIHEGMEQRALARTADLAAALAQLEAEVAARQRAEADLAEREALVQTLFSNAAVGMAMVDLTGRLMLVNDAFAQFLEAAPSELAGIELATLVHPDDVALDEGPRAELRFGTRRSYTVDKRFLGKCGAVVWGHLSVALLRDAGGRPLMTVLICEDITARMRADAERTRLERRLQEAERLESMGVLAGGVAHDFNNILTSIQGNADLASLYLPPGSPAREFLDQISQAVVRASDLTAQMLAYSGRRRSAAGAVDINRAIAEMSDLLRVGHTRHCVVRQNLTAGLPLVRAEATQVRQIVMNLVVNAAEALGPGGGEIVVSTGIDDLERGALDGLVLGSEAAPGRFVRVSVSDTGCGMDGETMARIFDPFFTTKLLGTGLGLASVYGIVREHHGALWVQSAPGMGTLFHIWLPAATG